MNGHFWSTQPGMCSLSATTPTCSAPLLLVMHLSLTNFPAQQAQPLQSFQQAAHCSSVSCQGRLPPGSPHTCMFVPPHSKLQIKTIKLEGKNKAAFTDEGSCSCSLYSSKERKCQLLPCRNCFCNQSALRLSCKGRSPPARHSPCLMSQNRR